MAISHVSASALVDRDAQTWAVITDGTTPLTITPGAGTYLAVFSATAYGDRNTLAETVDFAIYANAVQQHHSIRHIMHEESYEDLSKFMVKSEAVVTVADGQAVDVRWQTSVSGQAGHILKRSLTLVPITSYTQQTATSDDTTSSSDFSVTLGSMSATPGAGTYLLVFGCSAEFVGDTNDEIMATRVYVNGSFSGYAHTHRENIFEGSFDSCDQQLGCVCKVTPGASEVVSIRWANTGTAGTITCHERTLILVAIPSSDAIAEVYATSSADMTDTSWAQMNGMTLTNTSNALDGDWCAFFTCVEAMVNIPAAGAVEMYHALYADTTVITNTERDTNWSDSYKALNKVCPVGPTSKVTLADSDDLNVYQQGSTAETRRVFERVLVAVRDLGVAVEQYKFRWRDDDDDENSATWLAAEGINVSRGKLQNTRLRVGLDLTGDLGSKQVTLKYREQGSGKPWETV